ncbi:hypothetical protein C8Q78DRAFT_1048443 [Trametes maxima]|nr:hypothetical protein C8Q78DRAFT_1048443 [Trametes maxima]
MPWNNLLFLLTSARMSYSFPTSVVARTRSKGLIDNAQPELGTAPLRSSCSRPPFPFALTSTSLYKTNTMRRGFLLPKDKRRGQDMTVPPQTPDDLDAGKPDGGSVGTPKTDTELSAPGLSFPATGYGGMRRGFLSSKPLVATQEGSSRPSSESSLSPSPSASAQSSGGPADVAPLSRPNLALRRADTLGFGSLRRGFLQSGFTATRKVPQQIPASTTTLPLSSDDRSLVEHSKPITQHEPGAQEKVRIPSVHHKSMSFIPYYTLDMNVSKILVTSIPGDMDTSLIDITVALLWYGTKEKLMALCPGGQWPAPYEYIWPKLRFTVAPSNGKGWGLFAFEDIPAGGVILRERPLLITPGALGTYFGDKATPTVMNSMFNVLDTAVGVLQPLNRQWFLGLANCKRHSTYPYTEAWGIMETTALPTGPFPDAPGGYAAVGRDMSRVNHSCTPNADFQWDIETLTFTLRALKPIEYGEEIFISYLASAEVLAPRDARNSILTERWNFKCTCDICSRTGNRQIASDFRRAWMHRHISAASIRAQDERFVRWLQDGAPDPHLYLGKRRTASTLMEGEESLMEANSLGWNLQMWMLIEMEDYVPSELWESVLGRLVKGYSVLEQDMVVERFARRAAELSMTFSGTTGGWDKVAENPRETDWWAKLGDKRKDREESLAVNHGYACSEGYFDEETGQVYPEI